MRDREGRRGGIRGCDVIPKDGGAGGDETEKEERKNNTCKHASTPVQIHRGVLTLKHVQRLAMCEFDTLYKLIPT